MPRTVYAFILVSILGVGGAAAADTKVLDHHVANMRTGNLEGVLSDYAPDAVVVVPPGLANANGVFAAPTPASCFRS
jgi:hypothetical protein